ncbi:MAG: ribosome recycling factor, partial [Melioribacteraceae bacterium]|nr:ribosome recycling factor [Melioribacteraceae bacterium]
LSEDLRHDAEEDVQKVTDNHSKTIDAMIEHKEKEIMEI